MSRTQAPVTAMRSPETITKVVFRRLMPLLVIIYVIAFIDRTNIGMAKDRLEIDLGLSATAYGIGAGLFFLTYALSEIPSNLIMHKVGARFWFTRIMITWGLLSMAMSLIQGEMSFYILRMLLGIAEAGLFPGVMFYLTQWFPIKDRARAIGLFLLGVVIAQIVGSPLGGLLLMLDGLGGLHGWQWMFIIEGIPAVLLSVVVWKTLPNRPTEATFLTAEEGKDLEARIKAEEDSGADSAGNSSFRDVLRDKQILLVVGIYFAHQIAIYSLSFFLPSLIGTYGDLTTFEIGLLAAIPWIFAGIGAIFMPRFATKAGRSRIIAAVAMLGIAVGFSIGAVSGAVLGLIGFCLAAFSFYAIQPILFTFPATRMSGKRLAFGLAFINTIGLTGGFVGPYVMGFFEDATGNKFSGLFFVAAMCTVGALLSLKLRMGTEDPSKTTIAAH